MNFSFRSAMSIILAGSLVVASSVAWGTDTTSDVNFLNDAANMFSLILDVLYVIIWPLIVVAGWAMDNSLVLGEVFHLDKALLQFWQMMKNLANFTLGFLVLYEIARHLRGKGSEKEIVGTIGKAIVAGIGIQASWFLMIALLDISTIAIAGVGAMPLTVLDDDANNGHKIIQPVIALNNVGMDSKNPSYNFDGTRKEFYSITYTCKAKDENDDERTYTMTDKDGKVIKDKEGKDKKGKKSMMECRIYNDYLVARRPDLVKQKDTSYNPNYDPINHNYCVYRQQIHTMYNDGKYRYVPLFSVKDTDIKPPTETILTGATPGKKVFEIDFKDGSREGTLPKKTAEDGDQAFKCPTFGSLKQQATNMAGPLTTIYSSILKFSEISVVKDNDNMGRVSVMFLVKALTGIALILPLVVLTIALIKRVGYLWLALIGSPFIILQSVFDKSFLPEEISKKMSIGNIMGLIFMPVVTIFAMNLGIVFLVSLHQTISVTDIQQNNDLMGDFGIESKDETVGGIKMSCYKIFVTEVCYESNSSHGSGRDNFLNLFSGLIVQLFGIGVLWMMVFATFKISHVSEGLGDTVSKIGKSMALSAPIVPIGGGMGLGTLGVGGGGNKVLSGVKNYYDNKINTQAHNLFNKNKNKDTSKDNSGSKASKTPAVVGEINKTINNLAPATTGGAVTAAQVAKILNTTSQANDGKGITTKQRQDLMEHINNSKDKKAALSEKREIGIDANNPNTITVKEVTTTTPPPTENKQ